MQDPGVHHFAVYLHHDFVVLAINYFLWKKAGGGKQEHKQKKARVTIKKKFHSTVCIEGRNKLLGINTLSLKQFHMN